MNAQLAFAPVSASDAEGPCATPAARPTPAPPLLLDGIRQVLRARHYAARTELAYVEWIHRFFAHFPGRSVDRCGEPELRLFLEHLAREGATPSARNQARSALLLMFHAVLGQRLNCTDGMAHARSDGSGPVLLSRAEIERLLAAVEPGCALMVQLLYGSGLRPYEVVALRVRDIDLEARLIYIRDERGRKPERRALLPERLVAALQAHLVAGKQRHRRDLGRGAGVAHLPEAVRLEQPESQRDWQWQWLFPAAITHIDPLTRQGRRSRQHETVVVRALQAAARAARLVQPIDSYTLRHCFGMHLVEAGCDPDMVQAVLGAGEAACPLGGPRPAALRSPLDL